MNICESLTVTARWFPEKTAIVFEGQETTFAELNSLSQSAATVLAESGVKRGDRVALVLPNVPAFIVWYYAVLRVGAIAASIGTRLATSEISYVLLDCGAKGLVAEESTFERLKDHLPNSVSARFRTSSSGDRFNGQDLDSTISVRRSTWVDTAPDEAALILYTSGTTGFPKGATLSHFNVRSNVAAFNHLCNMQPTDRILLAVPLFHCFGQNALLNSALNVGATLVLQQKFDPMQARNLIHAERITQLYGVPMMFQLLHESCEPGNLATITYCFSAAAKLPIQVSQDWQAKFGMPIHEGYGLTETSPFASYNHRLKHVPGSIGTPIDSVEMKIVNLETGEECEPGELGEIAIRGPNVMLGYWNRSDDTATAIRQGWFHSGDIGRRDEDGFFYIVDRVKDMITVGGLKVFPAEVERVLLDHDSVAQAAVVGIPDPVFGEHVVAFVVLATSADLHREDAIRNIGHYAKRHLGNYKLPRRIVALDQLPLNPSGKVLKTDLRQYGLDTVSPSRESNDDSEVGDIAETDFRAAECDPPTLRKELEATYESNRHRVVTAFLQRLVQRICDLDALPEAESRFLDAGLDSLMIVELTGQLQVEVGATAELPATLVFEHPRISDLAECLTQMFFPSESADADRKQHKPTISSLEKSIAIRTEIERLSEEQALRQLMQELED